MDFWLWLVIFLVGTTFAAWYAWGISKEWNSYISWDKGYNAAKDDYWTYAICPDCWSALLPDKVAGPGHFFCDACICAEFVKQAEKETA